MLSKEELYFLKSVSTGIFEVLYTEDVIGKRPKNRVERYIADSFTGRLGWCGVDVSFSPELFSMTLDTMTGSEVIEMLEYFDRHGWGLVMVYELSENLDETCPIVEEIRSGRMVSFRQFIDF